MDRNVWFVPYALLLAAACGDSFINDLPDRPEMYTVCDSTSTSCSCDANDFSLQPTSTCTAATVGGSARCCATPDWPRSGRCECEREPIAVTPPTITCGFDGSFCRCNDEGLLGQPSCFDGGTGVCCLYSASHNCTCYTTLTSCDTAEVVPFCDPAVVYDTFPPPAMYVCNDIEVTACFE